MATYISRGALQPEQAGPTLFKVDRSFILRGEGSDNQRVKAGGLDDGVGHNRKFDFCKSGHAIGLALFQRRTWRRAILFLIVLIECLGSTAMLAASELEPYDGPAQVGAPLPAFEAKLAASGEAFTEADLASGTQVLVFYRGHL